MENVVTCEIFVVWLYDDAAADAHNAQRCRSSQCTVGKKSGRFETYNHTLFHELGSERVSERMIAAERMSEASGVEQAIEQAVRANVLTDEQVARYLFLDSWLF